MVVLIAVRITEETCQNFTTDVRLGKLNPVRTEQEVNTSEGNMHPYFELQGELVRRVFAHVFNVGLEVIQLHWAAHRRRTFQLSQKIHCFIFPISPLTIVGLKHNRRLREKSTEVSLPAITTLFTSRLFHIHN